LDPHVQLLPHLPPVATIEELVPLKDYLKSELYNDQIKPQSMRYLMNIMLRSRDRLIGRLLLTRQAHAGNFTSRDKAKAQLMVSHLNPILEEKMLLQHIENTNELLESLIVTIPNRGIIILDESFKPIHMDQAAKENLAFWFQTEWSQQGLEFNIPEEIHHACEILKKDACEDQDFGCLEHRLTVELGLSRQPLPVLLRMVKPHDKPVIFLVCLNPEYHKMPFNRRLETLGLTPREQEVSHLVSEGLDNEQIADKLCISTLTLGTHLKSIYGKLGVNSRSSLIHRLFSFK
jgi:DNA-binding CsgD family transcriptional regulator